MGEGDSPKPGKLVPPYPVDHCASAECGKSFKAIRALEAEVELLRQRVARESAAAMLWKQRAQEAGWDA